MKRLFVALILCALATPVLAAVGPMNGWDIQLAVNAGYTTQTFLDAAGQKETKFVPTGLSGIQFWRDKSIFGFSAGAAGLPDEGEKLPRVAPYGAFHLGTKDAQFFLGGDYDPQSKAKTKAGLVFGFTAAF